MPADLENGESRAKWTRCGVALVRSWVDERVWSPVLEQLDIASIVNGAGGLNRAKLYAITEARRYGHIEPGTTAADLRWVKSAASFGSASLELEARSRG